MQEASARLTFVLGPAGTNKRLRNRIVRVGVGERTTSPVAICPPAQPNLVHPQGKAQPVIRRLRRRRRVAPRVPARTAVDCIVFVLAPAACGGYSLRTWGVAAGRPACAACASLIEPEPGPDRRRTPTTRMCRDDQWSSRHISLLALARSSVGEDVLEFGFFLGREVTSNQLIGREAREGLGHAIDHRILGEQEDR